MIKHTYLRRVHFHETDMAGLVHFSNFFRYAEEAEEDLFRNLGQGAVDRIWAAGQPDGMGWVRIGAELKYKNPAKIDDLLEVVLTLTRITSRGLVFDVRIAKGDDLVAEGRLETFCVRQSPDGPRAAAIPDNMVAALTESTD